MRRVDVPPSSDLEAAFAREMQERAAQDTRWGVLNTLFMYPVFIPLDFLVYPEAASLFLWIRLGVVGLSIVVHFMMNLAFARKHARLFGAFAYLYCTLAIVLMVHLVDGYASPYYAGINLVLISFLFILPMSVKLTATVCAVVYAAYIVPIVVRGGITDIPVLAANNFFLVSTMLLVVMSSFLATNMRRKEFTSRFELARANEELKKLDVVKSQFFASISHEIRTPLTSIMAPTDSLFRGDVGELSPAQRTLVGQVHRNSLRLLDLINQMLDFAKFDAKEMKLHLKRVNLARVVRSQIALFQEVCRRKGLTLEGSNAENIPVVFLDHEKTERILSNLIRNAIKFTERGTVRVELELEPAVTGSNDDDEHNRGPGVEPTGWLAVRVKDTGIGIAAHHMEKVFQRFQQVDGSSTRRYEGTGLGLAIVQEAVDLQHGSIAVESAEGEGSTFTVRLPVNLDEIEPEADIDRRQEDRRQEDLVFPGPDRRMKPRRNDDYGKISVSDIAFVESSSIHNEELENGVIPQSRPDSGIRVLYVEDSSDLRSYISHMLRSFGHTVTTANDGVAGWRQAQEHLPDIVVSDLMMPGIDGFELLQLIKTTAATQRIPVILITAKSEVESRIEGLETGADDYIPKPVDIRELDARIRNIIATREFRDALTRADELEGRMKELALGFSQALELRDGYTAGHSDDVLAYGTIIAEELGVPMDRVLREALLLHDIGKLGVPDGVLRKPAPLDADEWKIMRRHPEMGADLLMRFESLKPVSRIVLAHHERYDGTGYPLGLVAQEIPLQARIISVADAWHAMREDRTYRQAVPLECAIRELLTNQGRQFDPEIVAVFLRGLLGRDMISAESLENAGRPGVDSVFSPDSGR
ncbi:MAG: HD domain-containing phosphohydrolase [Spirochaetota bacterium]